MHVCILNKAPGVCVNNCFQKSVSAFPATSGDGDTYIQCVSVANTHRNKSVSKPAALSRFPEQTPTPSQIKTH